MFRVSILSGLLAGASVAFAADKDGPPAPVKPWADYRLAPDALQEIDLASDTAWTLAIDGGAPRPIKVTAGGWNSEQQSPQIPGKAAKDHVLYERPITIPAEAKGRVVQVLFGGCNYGAEVYLDEKKVAEVHGPMIPFAADLTGVAVPGQTHRLKVKAYCRYHYGDPPLVPVGFDFNAGMSRLYDGCTKYAYGLMGYARLAVYPAVYICDLFVRPSVAAKTLSYDVWIANGSTKEQQVTLKGALSSWDKRSWAYPELPDRKVVLPPRQTVKVSVEKVPWNLGPESYWWPNIPFREDYRATLHCLRLRLKQGWFDTLHERRQRFGFVEYQEGPYYYTVNGVRFTSFGDSNSYGQIGEYDCWYETPCFQRPSGEHKGLPETWRRYQKIGFNSMRLSTSVPSRYMMEAADEAGFMLIPEGGSFGNNTSAFTEKYFCFQIQETIRACRNHPCVARYSLANETGFPPHTEHLMVDAAREVDATRPLVFEGTDRQVSGKNGGHASPMAHYLKIEKAGHRFLGMGECAWATDGMPAFIAQALELRLNDYAHFGPWSWLNYWPNFLEGMSAQRHPWKFNNYGNRKDGVDGWDSPMVQAVQWALHPFLVIDRGLLEGNPVIREGSKAGKVEWPFRLPVYPAGASVERRLEVFNGALSGDAFTLKWAARWDSPTAPDECSGAVGPFKIEPGFHGTQTVTFEAPKPDKQWATPELAAQQQSPSAEPSAPVRTERTLFLILDLVRDGKVVFHDERSRFTVTANPRPSG